MIVSQQLVDILKHENKTCSFVHDDMSITFSVHSVYQVDKLSVVIERSKHGLSTVQMIPISTVSIDDICKQIANFLMDAKNTVPITETDVKFNLLNLKELL